MHSLVSILRGYSLIGIRNRTFYSSFRLGVHELQLFDTTFMEIFGGPDP